MTLGAEPKKLAILGALLVAAPIAYNWANSGSGPPEGAAGSASKSAGRIPERIRAADGSLAAPPDAARQTAARIAARNGRDRGMADYKPSLKPRRPEDRPDPMTVDPTLRLTLVSRLKDVAIVGGRRSLFDFGAAVASGPKPIEPKILPKPARLIGPERPPPPAADPAKTGPVAPPPPPPLPFKFYGFIGGKPAGAKKAFFLEGDDVYIAGEGELVKKRYKVVRIGVNSVVMEDTQEKNQQTLQMVEEQQGA